MQVLCPEVFSSATLTHPVQQQRMRTWTTPCSWQASGPGAPSPAQRHPAQCTAKARRRSALSQAILHKEHIQSTKGASAVQSQALSFVAAARSCVCVCVCAQVRFCCACTHAYACLWPRLPCNVIHFVRYPFLTCAPKHTCRGQSSTRMGMHVYPSAHTVHTLTCTTHTVMRTTHTVTRTTHTAQAGTHITLVHAQNMHSYACSHTQTHPAVRAATHKHTHTAAVQAHTNTHETAHAHNNTHVHTCARAQAHLGVARDE